MSCSLIFFLANVVKKVYSIPKMKEVDDDDKVVKEVKGKGKGKGKSSKKTEEKEVKMDEDEENQSPVKEAPKKNGVIDDSDED